MTSFLVFRDMIRKEKAKKSYLDFEQEYPGVNRYFFWMLVNDDDYVPPKNICHKLGIRLSPPRQPPVRVGKCSPEEWRIIKGMTPAERLRAMIEYGKD